MGKRPTAKYRHAEKRGHRSETIAAWWLRLKGYRVLGRRIKTHAGEIDLAAHYAGTEPPRGEVTLLVGPPHETQADFAAIDAALAASLPFMPLKAASDMIAALTGASRKAVYARGLEKKNG